MPVPVLGGIAAGLATIATQMAIKLLGYKFITNATVSLLKEWAMTTETTADDEITIAAAEAWDVDVDDLRAFIKKKQGK
jgi:hypothetical protein